MVYDISRIFFDLFLSHLQDDGGLIEDKFMQIIQNMRLSDLETAALRLAIAENDPSIRVAIDQFRSDLDEDNLMNAMKDAARGVIQRTLTSRMGQAFSRGVTTADQNDEQESPVDEVDADESKSNINSQSPAKKSLLSPPKATGNSNYEEEFDEIEDIDEEEDTGDDGVGEEGPGNESGSLLLSQTARDHIFPILVQELIKENILSKADGRIVLQEFVAGNPVVSSALDLYDRDNDMAVLVESLQLMVENIRKA